MKPGEATYTQTGEDEVTLSWEGRDGTLSELPLTLRELAELEAGKPFAAYARARRYTLRERIGAHRAKGDQIAARMDEMRRKYPGIDSAPQDP